MITLEKLIEKIIGLAYADSWRRGGRTNKPIGKLYGKPGEVINSLSYEEREVLQNLKSEDLSLERIPRGQIELFTSGEQPYSMLKDKCLDFDKRILK